MKCSVPDLCVWQYLESLNLIIQHVNYTSNILSEMILCTWTELIIVCVIKCVVYAYNSVDDQTYCITLIYIQVCQTGSKSYAANLSELAGRLVTGLKRQTLRKQRYKRYSKPTLNGVNWSNTLQRKVPPA